MDNEGLFRTMTPQQYGELIDAAKARAIELRCEAIYDFWSGVAKRGRRVWQGMRQSAPRQGAPVHPVASIPDSGALSPR